MIHIAKRSTLTNLQQCRRPIHILHTGWPKKVATTKLSKKLCLIVLKSDNDFRFLRQIEEMIKHYNIIHRY